MEIKGSNIVERIDQVALEKGMNRPDICQKVGLASNTFSNWSIRGTIPSADVAIKIADVLGVAIRWLITGEDEEYTRDELSLVAKYRYLDEQGQFEIQTLLDAKLKVINSGQKKQSAG